MWFCKWDLIPALGHRDLGNEKIEIPVTSVPRPVPFPGCIFQQDDISRPELLYRTVARLNLYRTREECQELPGRRRVQVTIPPGFKRIEQISRCWSRV